MKALKTCFILLLFTILTILLLLKQCGSEKPTVITKIDTVTTIRVDSVFMTKIVIKVIHDLKPIKRIPLSDTTGLYLCNSLNTYQDSLVDSNVIITAKQTIRGELKEEWLTYKLLVPKYITKTITNNITRDVIVNKTELPKISIFGGVGIGGNKSQLSLIEPYIGIRCKNIYVDYGYNLINQTNNIRLGINLFNLK